MALTRVATTGGYSYSDTLTLDTDASISVQAGDIIAVAIAGRQAAGALPTVAISLVSGADSATMSGWRQYGSNTDLLLRTGYIVITESRSAVVRATASSVLGIFNLSIMHYRPDAGETVTVYTNSAGTYGTTALIQSALLSASGDDIVYFGAGWNNSGPPLNSEQIGGVAADAYVRNGRGGIWCRAFSASQSDLRATAAFSDNDAWLADIFAFSSDEPSPTGHTLAYDINEGTHGSAPAGGTYEANASVTVAARPVHMVRFGYSFTSWNTAIDGSGVDFAPDSTLTMPDEDVTLYAQWVGYHTVTTPLIIRHGSHDPSALSNAEVSAAAIVDVYAENASVGEDIWGNSTTNSSTGVDHNGTDPCGLALLYADNSRYLMSRDYNEYGCDATWFATHHGLQNNFRDNPGFATKLSGFASNMATMGPSVKVAFVKMCFIDGPSDPDIDYDSYISAINVLRAAYPDVTFVLWTMPIESAANTDHNPANRQHFNVMVRQIAIDTGVPLFDLADIESDGGTIVSSGRECLSDSYTVDGGHLHAVGKLKAGGAVWRLLDLFAVASSPVPVILNHYRQQE